MVLFTGATAQLLRQAFKPLSRVHTAICRRCYSTTEAQLKQGTPSTATSDTFGSLRNDFDRDGFVLLPEVFSKQTIATLRDRYDDLFAGRFPTGVYPDEWHWRQGLSLPDAPREIVNGWKSDPIVKHVALSPILADIARALTSWPRDVPVQLGQDDVLWKPPGATEVRMAAVLAHLRICI
jgi:hypothetical protein